MCECPNGFDIDNSGRVCIGTVPYLILSVICIIFAQSLSYFWVRIVHCLFGVMDLHHFQVGTY